MLWSRSGIKQANTYDAAGRLSETREYFGVQETYNGNQIVDFLAGWLKGGETYKYDADGRITEQKVYGRKKAWTIPTSTLTIQSGSGVTLATSPLTNLSTTLTYYDTLG